MNKNGKNFNHPLPSPGKGGKEWLGFLPVIAALVIWEIVGRSGIFSPGLFPPFSRIFLEFISLLKSGLLVENFLASLLRVLAGFISGSLLGILVGMLMGSSRHLDMSFRPLISILYPIPALGWLPLLMLWIGINEALPIAIIFICSFFPVCYNTISGIRGVDTNYVRVARTLGASRIRVLRTILFPLALPSIFTGLRLEAGMAWRVIIAAEMVAIPTGIGALMMRAESLIRMDIIIICLLILSLMTFLFERIFICLERKATRWKSR